MADPVSLHGRIAMLLGTSPYWNGLSSSEGTQEMAETIASIMSPSRPPPFSQCIHCGFEDNTLSKDHWTNCKDHPALKAIKLARKQIESLIVTRIPGPDVCDLIPRESVLTIFDRMVASDGQCHPNPDGNHYLPKDKDGKHPVGFCG